MKCNSFNFQEIFLNEGYEDCIKFYQEEIDKENECLNDAYYMLASIIASNDIYLGLSIIKKSKLLNSEEVIRYLDKEGANLLNLLVENDEMKKTVILLTFINGNKDNDMNDVEVGFKYFEMIDNLYEIGYSSVIIKELTNVGHILFKM